MAHLIPQLSPAIKNALCSSTEPFSGKDDTKICVDLTKHSAAKTLPCISEPARKDVQHRFAVQDHDKVWITTQASVNFV